MEAIYVIRVVHSYCIACGRWVSFMWVKLEYYIKVSTPLSSFLGLETETEFWHNQYMVIILQ